MPHDATSGGFVGRAEELARLRELLGVATRVEAAAVAHRLGLDRGD
jgi:hypothetical protein